MAYRCAALDTPLAYIWKKIDPRPPVGGRSAARRAVFRPPGRILARKSVFCYCTPDFVNGPFVTLDDIFDLAPSDRFLLAVRPLGGPFSGHRAGFWPENPFFAIGSGFRRWPVCNPRQYLRFGTFGSIFSGRSGELQGA